MAEEVKRRIGVLEDDLTGSKAEIETLQTEKGALEDGLARSKDENEMLSAKTGALMDGLTGYKAEIETLQTENEAARGSHSLLLRDCSRINALGSGRDE